MSRKTALPGTILPPDDPRHGSHAGYNYYRCRCEVCKDFHTAYKYEKRGIMSHDRYCTEVDCSGRHYGHGLCKKHWSRKFQPYVPSLRAKPIRQRRVVFSEPLPPLVIESKPKQSEAPWARLPFDPDRVRAAAYEGWL